MKQLRGGLPQINTNLMLTTNWGLFATLDDSDKDRAQQGIPRNLLESFRMVNLVTQNWSYIIGVYLMVMGFNAPQQVALRLLMFLQFLSSSIDNHDFMFYELLDKDDLKLENKVLNGHPNFSLVIKVLNTMLQKLVRKGFSELANEELLFSSIKYVVQTNLNINYTSKVTSLFNSVFKTSISREVLDSIEVESDIKEPIIELCNEFQIELNEEYVKRVQLLYEHVNIYNHNHKKILLYGKPGVGKNNLLRTTSALVHKIQSMKWKFFLFVQFFSNKSIQSLFFF